MDETRMGRLRELAGRLAWLIEHPAHIEARWLSPDFGTRVERVRGQLRPIQSHAALAESYVREASRRSTVDTAYATRWLELGGVIGDHPWPHLWERGGR